MMLTHFVDRLLLLCRCRLTSWHTSTVLVVLRSHVSCLSWRTSISKTVELAEKNGCYWNQVWMLNATVSHAAVTACKTFHEAGHKLVVFKNNWVSVTHAVTSFLFAITTARIQLVMYVTCCFRYSFRLHATPGSGWRDALPESSYRETHCQKSR